jgi:predicted  nucleic acid-binding Zn-ribbon protein
VNVQGQLLRLVRLQEVALDTAAARQSIENAPRRLMEIENRFRERNAEYVAIKERHEALEADQRHRSGELAMLEDHRKKYRADLMQVQNQREYAAILKEIDTVSARIAEHEESVLKDMEELETVRQELATHEAHIQQERRLVEQEHAEVEAAVEKARSAVAEHDEERRRLEAELPKSLVDGIRRLEEGRQGQFLARAEDGTCQSCFVRLRPQSFQEIKLGVRLHYCGHCRRLLYHEPSLKRIAAEADAIHTEKPGQVRVEAVDRGAL